MIRYLLMPLIIYLLLSSCSTKIISTNYYQEKKETVDSIESRYEKLNARKPFAIAFTDKKLNIISYLSEENCERTLEALAKDPTRTAAASTCVVLTPDHAG